MKAALPALSARTRRARAALVAAFAALVALVRPPGLAAAEPRLGVVSNEAVPESTPEIDVGRQSAQELGQTLGLVADDTLQQYVQSVGAKLAAGSERPSLPWTFRVLDDPSPNAFALPGGFIFITRGLVDLLNSEAELATVLAHEIGHVAAGHPAQHVADGQLSPLGLGLGVALVPQLARYDDLASASLRFVFLKYTRDEEREADDLGFQYVLRQNYDVREMAGLFVALQVGSRATGQSPLPSWRTTHPYGGERLERTRAHVTSVGNRRGGSFAPESTISGAVGYLRHVEGLVYGVNPRQGYFWGSAFIHPDLRLRIDFPSGWKKRNLASAAVATNPAQGTVIQLSLLPQGDPASALQAFLARPGVKADRPFEEPNTSVPTTGSYFRVMTARGALQGVVAYLAHDGRTYQLLAYAPAGRLAQHDAAFRRTFISFSPLVDPQLLNVQPHRIGIERAEETLSLVEFNTHNPSASPLDDVVRLNQLPSPDAQIPAGELVKRVVEGSDMD